MNKWYLFINALFIYLLDMHIPVNDQKNKNKQKQVSGFLKKNTGLWKWFCCANAFGHELYLKGVSQHTTTHWKNKTSIFHWHVRGEIPSRGILHVAFMYLINGFIIIINVLLISHTTVMQKTLFNITITITGLVYVYVLNTMWHKSSLKSCIISFLKITSCLPERFSWEVIIQHSGGNLYRIL